MLNLTHYLQLYVLIIKKKSQACHYCELTYPITHPNKPRIDGAEHASLLFDSFLDGGNIIDEPSVLHGAKIRTYG
jgi:hypothetical protein